MAKALRAMKEWKLATSYSKRGKNTGYIEKGVKRQNGKGGAGKGGWVGGEGGKMVEGGRLTISHCKM